MMRYHIPQLGPDPNSPFPPPGSSGHPEGLVAWGGDLSPKRLLNAYRHGIFPWFEHGSPILWWSPEPRAVLIPHQWHLARRLRRTLRQGRFQARIDLDFSAVLNACAGPRQGQSGTWITDSMREAYQALHDLGHAHSFEIIQDGQLTGGLYGVALGKIFFAESKFHARRDASKIALAVMMRCLETWGFRLADCQLWNPHLERMGVRLYDMNDFRRVIDQGISEVDRTGPWSDRIDTVNLNDW